MAGLDDSQMSGERAGKEVEKRDSDGTPDRKRLLLVIGPCQEGYRRST
jgi:hypothetical protein